MKDLALNETIKELSQRYNKKGEMVEIMIAKCKELNYNINESKKLIMQFFNI